MKTLASILLLCLCFVAGAQEYKSRQPRAIETKRIAGISQYVQDVFYRDHVPVFTTTNALQSITNLYEGLFIVMPTNVAAGVTLELPNPTNNIGRVFRFMNPQATQFHLSNSMGGFTESASLGVSNLVWCVFSNKLTTAWSTGTNYFVKVQ